MAQGETITITDNGDGTFAVQVTGGAPEPGEDPSADAPQTLKSVEEVCRFVEQELGEDDSGAQSAWADEASQRDSTGQRKPGSAAPKMTM